MSHPNTNNHPLGAGGADNDVSDVGRFILNIANIALAWVNQPPETNNIQNDLNRIESNNSSLVNNSAPLPTWLASMATNPTPQASSTPASSYQSKSLVFSCYQALPREQDQGKGVICGKRLLSKVEEVWRVY